MDNIKLINACNYHYTELLQKVILKHNAFMENNIYTVWMAYKAVMFSYKSHLNWLLK